MKKKLPSPSEIPFRRERILSAGILAFLAPLPLAFSNSVRIPYLVIYLFLLCLHLAFVRAGRILCLPNWALNVFGVFFFYFAYFDARYVSRSLILTTAHILLGTSLFKIASIKRERDFATLLILIAFLFVGAVATSFHVLILLFVFGYALVAWPILVKWALWRDLAANPSEWRRDPRTLRLPGWRASLLAVSAILVAGIPFFVLLPRIKQPYVRGVSSGQEVWTGFSESVDPGVTGRIKQNEKVYLRVETDAPIKANSDSGLRFRALAFTRWDGRTWVASPEIPRPISGAIDSFAPLVAVDQIREASRFKMTIDLSPLSSRYFPVPPHPVAIRIPSGSARNAGGGLIERDSLSNLRFMSEPQQTVQYQVLYGGPPILDLTAPQASSESRKALGSDRIAQWARQIGGDVNPQVAPERFALRIEAYLSTKFRYSLNSPMSGKQPVEEFLFERKEGHCEAFATAMALAVREAGIPSRLVTGFLGAEAGLFGRYYLVRGSNAHAWVEIWAGPQKGWLVFDPTPAEGRPGLAELSWMQQMRNASDSVVFFYDRYILSFGQADQAELIQAVRDRAVKAVEATKEAASWVKRRGPSLLAGSLGLLALLVLGSFAARALSRRGVWRFGAGSEPPGVWAYKKLQRKLRRMGGRLSRASAPGQTLAEAARFGPAVHSAAAAIVRTYLAESFGGVRSGVPERLKLELALRSVSARKKNE